MKNYKEYLDYCKNLALDISEDYTLDEIEVTDRIHEIADGCTHVIYYAKAWDLVNMMRICNGQLFNQAVEDAEDYLSFDGDINKQITLIAYLIIRNGIHSAYQHIESKEESILEQHAYVHNYNA